MEQRQLPIILVIMTFILVSGFIIKKIDYETFSLPQILESIHDWLQWKIMPGW